ncbi:MAG: DUF4920 domain-containing protein, partial [Proteobacteria bacterium]|nr:DUF4920 domain-containing protein [Pseudomonadota bacterium]
MRTILLSASLLFVSELALANLLSFGKFSNAKLQPVGLKTALDNYKDSHKEALLITGTVKKICEKKGCWLQLEDQNQSVHVSFKDYSFFVTQKIKDKPVLAEGRLVKTEHSVQELQHLARDAGESEAAVSQIKDAKVDFEFIASGIREIQ